MTVLLKKRKSMEERRDVEFAAQPIV
jgi:hypothetical protein